MSYLLTEQAGWTECYQTANYAVWYPWLLIKLHCNIDTITAAYWTTRAAWQHYPRFLQELTTFKGPLFLLLSYLFQAWSSVVHSNNWLCSHETSLSELHLLCISPLQWLHSDSTWLTNTEKQPSLSFLITYKLKNITNNPQVKTAQIELFLFIDYVIRLIIKQLR